MMLLWITLFSACSLSYQFLISAAIASVTGWTVWAQVAGMSLFLAAMGVGTLRSERISDSWLAHAIFRREIGLALAGALSVPAVLLIYSIIKIFAHNPTLDPFVATEASLRSVAWLSLPIPVLLGYLAGFELPLLLRLRGERASGAVLAFNYLGALLASLAFTRWLGHRVSPIEAGLLLAWINGFAAVGFAWQSRALSIRNGALAIALLACVSGLASVAQDWEEFYLQIRYSRGVRALRVRGVGRFLEASIRNDLRVSRVRTAYQNLDFVTRAGQPETEFYIDGKIQLHASWAAEYHESLVHLPIQFFQRVPRDVLVLGAGDGLVAHELLKYKSLEKVVLVELDPAMIELGKSLSFFRKLNGGALDDPRVHVIVEDALAYLRSLRGAQHSAGPNFDAIYLDFPLPFDYDLLKLYSYEIYQLAAQRLKPGGFIALDAATVDPSKADPRSAAGFARWRQILSSTLSAAGFRQVIAYEGSEGFIAARLNAEHAPSDQFVDHGIELKVVNAAYLARALRAAPLPPPDSSSVNSIFRPQLHSLQDFQF